MTNQLPRDAVQTEVVVQLQGVRCHVSPSPFDVRSFPVSSIELRSPQARTLRSRPAIHRGVKRVHGSLAPRTVSRIVARASCCPAALGPSTTINSPPLFGRFLRVLVGASSTQSLGSGDVVGSLNVVERPASPQRHRRADQPQWLSSDELGSEASWGWNI